MHNVIEFVKKELNNEFTGHDFSHAERVVSNAIKIMEKEGGNYLIIITSCYIHDLVDDKIFSDIDKQNDKIKTFLKSLNYNTDDIDQIIFIINNISYRKNVFLTDLNAQIVRDADRLDALGAMGIIRTIEFGASRKRKFYSSENIKKCNGKFNFNKSTNTTLSHFYDKLLKLYDLMHTTTAKEIAKERTEFLKLFLEEFYKEL